MSFQVAAFQPAFQQGFIPAARTIIDVNDILVIHKDPDDDLLLTFDWSEVLGLGVSLVSVTHTSSLPLVLVASNQATDDSDGTSDVDLAGGVHGSIYVLTTTATLSDASTVTRSWPVRAFNG